LTTITICERSFEIDCIVFDKDGTLIELSAFWRQRTVRWVKQLADLLIDHDGFENSVYEIIGYDPDQSQVLPESPLAVATMENIYTLAAGVLCQHGIPWHKAKQVAEQYAKNPMGGFFDPDDIHPRGNIAGLLQRLGDAQVQVAVVTSDDRMMTSKTLVYMGIDHLVNILVCGDDDIPNKPAPDAIWHISEQLDIPPDRMIMVGDTLSDMEFGKNAGVGGLVGIQYGRGENSFLAAHAEIIIDSIDKITIDQ